MNPWEMNLTVADSQDAPWTKGFEVDPKKMSMQERIKFIDDKMKQMKGTPEDPTKVIYGAIKAFGEIPTFGFLDELNAAFDASTGYVAQKLASAVGAEETAKNIGGGKADRPWREFYKHYLGKEEQEQKEFTQAHPMVALGATLAGVVANPANAARSSFLGDGKLFQRVVKGGASALAEGALYGLGSGEGGIENRLENAVKIGALSAALGAATPVAAEGVKAVGRGLAGLTGMTSGAGGESVKQAYKAGASNSETFRKAMRGKSNVFEAVDDAEQAIKSMEQKRSIEFAKALPKKGDFLLPEKAVQDAYDTAATQISGVTAGVDDVAADALNKVTKLLDNINNEGGFTFNNALEAKKAVDGIIQPLIRKGEKNAVRIIQPIQNAIKSTMIESVPEYGTALRNFSEATRIIESIKSAISSGKSPTTELRALQGITRQSVAGAQGGKIALGQILDEVSGGKLLDKIAGGQVSQLWPRDVLRGVAGIGAALRFDPVGVSGALAMSPRVVGESAYKLGQLSTALSKLPNINVPAYSLVGAGQKF